MEKTFLITGGAGYIGSNIAYYLLKNNYNIIIVDNFSNSNNLAIKRLENSFNTKIKTYNGDVCNLEFIDNILKNNSIYGVIHLAAKKYIGESFLKEKEYLDNNINSTKNVLNCMSKYNVKNIYFASSITVFGDPVYTPFNNQHPLSPLSPYANSKVLCEQLIANWQQENSKNNAVIFRFTNPVGARNDVMLGDDPKSNYSNLLPYLVKCMEQNKPISINGNTHPTKDGTTVRDYIHITDLAECVFKICTRDITGLNYIIVGNGKIVYSVLDVIHSLGKVYNTHINYTVNPKRPNDTPMISVNNDYIVNNLNYQPKCSMDDIILSQVQFERFKNTQK